ncbi:MAG: hypothetical protein HYV18_03720 [Gammaproteobacteria bacterium]|nr:hypothetical protein [Gammaproteobacteria bacterium]
MKTAQVEAIQADIARLAVDAIVNGYPIERAVRIAVREVRSFLGLPGTLRRVIFACFGAGMLEAYELELSCA